MMLPSYVQLATITEPIMEGKGCGDKTVPVFFLAPITLEVGDQIFVDLRHGQPLAIYRRRLKIWEYTEDNVWAN